MAAAIVGGAPGAHGVEILEREPIGSMILWQVAHGSLARCSSICWRMVGLTPPCRTPACGGSGGTLGGGGGGSTPRNTCITVLPRMGGIVPLGLEEMVISEPLPSKPRRMSNCGASSTRRKLLP